MKTVQMSATLLCVVLLTTACWAQAGDNPLPKPAANDVIQVVDKDAKNVTKIDWTLLQVRAIGIGLAPEGATGAKATALAREAAQVIAERNLLKAMQGVHVTSETTVENLALKSDVINEKVQGIVKGAYVVQEEDLKNGAYKVTMAIRLLGEKGIAEAVDLPAEVNTTVAQQEPAPPTTATDIDGTKITGDFTGLLIDCRGLKLSESMSPAVLAPDNEAVYPRKDIAPEVVIEKGVVSYYKNTDAAIKEGRVGKHPLVIKASDVKKDGDKMFYVSPIVKQADAARILAEDNRTQFLGKLAVGFILD